MSQILENLSKLDPKDTDAVKEIITAFFQNLMKHTELNCNSWLRVLDFTITRFPRYCAQHRGTAEQYLAHFVDSPNYHDVIVAAKCAHGLQQIRPSQDKAATPKNCWREQMDVLCHAAHQLIEAASMGALDIYKGGGGGGVKRAGGGALAAALGAGGRRASRADRLANVLVFMQAMLVEPFPVAKPVRPRPVLEVVARALLAGDAALKAHALRTLDALVCCLGAHLIPYSALVFRCVMQTLRWSSDDRDEQSRQVRRAAFESLRAWLLAAGPLAPRALGDELAAQLAQEMAPRARALQLAVGEAQAQPRRLSNKARRRLARAALQRSSLAPHAPSANTSADGDDEAARAALRCAEVFLAASGAFLRPALHQMLQERLVRECERAAREATRRTALPLLLRALHAARASPPGARSPAHHLLRLCAALRHSACAEVREWCARALTELRLQLHAAPPSLHFAQAAPRAAATPNISKKNRDALAALLGRDRLTLSSDEVITIADEPSTKRARLDSQVVASDNISVSSDSVESIDSGDDSDRASVGAHSDSEKHARAASRVISDVDARNIEIEDALNVENQMDAADGTSSTSQAILHHEALTEQTNIYEAKTQVPLNISTDQDAAEDDERFVSMEVVYDHNLEKKTTILERTEDDNLPSSNDMDDVQITCGQIIQCSQELDAEKNKDSEEIPKMYGINEIAEDTSKINGMNNAINGVAENSASASGDSGGTIERVELKITTKEITVDDMLADFVDEPIDIAPTEA